MSPEQLKQEIKLIFARECAAAMREQANHLLRVELSDEEKDAYPGLLASFYTKAFSDLAAAFSFGVPSHREQVEAELKRVRHADQALADYRKSRGGNQPRPLKPSLTSEEAESSVRKSAPNPAPPSSTHEAAPQESEASLYQLLQQSLKIQTLIQERIDQLSAH